MVHHIMITMDTESDNVQRFAAWCNGHSRSCEVQAGTRVASLCDIKPYLTPYGWHSMHNRRESSCHFDSLGPVGCFLAHRSAWETCVRRGEATWIFEEGVRSFDTDTFDRLDANCGHADLILGHTVPVLRMWKQRTLSRQDMGNGLVSIDKIYFGTKCYRVSPGFAARLLQESARFDTHVDTFVNTTAMYYADEFVVGRTVESMVGAGSSHRIRHSVDHGLLILSCMLAAALGSAVLLAVMTGKYRTCSRQRSNRG